MLTLARLATTLRLVTATVGAATFVSGCKGSPTGPPPVATVSVGVPSASLFAGSTQQLAAVAKAADGTVLSNRTVAWSSSNTAAATVSTTGLLSAVSPGITTITATIDGKSGSGVVTVLQVPVASVSIAPIVGVIVVGDAQQLTVTLRDAAGVALTGRTVAWTSSNPSVATIGPATGILTALAAGTATITAVSEGLSGTLTVNVLQSGIPPQVTSITPATLVPGAVATITGTLFSPTAANNSVIIQGNEVPVLSATATQLTLRVPCVNTGNVNVVVTSNGLASNVTVKPLAATVRTIAVGQALVLTNNAESVCNELSTSGAAARYIVAVFSASTSQNTLVDFEIGGNTPLIGAAAKAVAPLPNLTSSSLVIPSEEQQRDDAHWRMLERDRAQYEQLIARARSLPRALPSLRTAALPVVGDLRDFFFTFTAGCNSTATPMHTKAIYVGTHSVIWEDSENTLQSATQSDYLGFYQRLGQIFDQDQYESLKTNFGDPLLRDTLTDNDGRIHMVFSQKLNGSGAAAFVTSCDQFPRSQAAGSNFGEVFYGSVPVTAGSNVNSTNFADGWFYFMARTVVHEVKHIVSVAARVQNNSPTSEQSWLEEGTARHAEEMWVRESLHHVNWKANTGFGTAATNGVYCDFHPLDGICNATDLLRRPSYGMRRQFNEIRDKLLAPWDWSPYGDGATQSGSVFYQTTWSLVRYTMDRYATSEPAFFKALINSNTSGTTNLSAVAGVPMDQLIGAWGLALFSDDYPGLTNASNDLKFQTWNLRNIYAGLNASPNWVARFPVTFPIQPLQLAFGTFSSARSGLRGGAHSFYEISGTARPIQLIQLRGPGGTTPSTNLRIAIARLQ